MNTFPLPSTLLDVAGISMDTRLPPSAQSEPSSCRAVAIWNTNMRRNWKLVSCSILLIQASPCLPNEAEIVARFLM